MPQQNNQNNTQRNNNELMAFKTEANIDITIKSRKETLFSGKAKALSSNNEEGEFDVLPQHANFITMVKDFVRVENDDGEVFSKDIDRGVMRVYEGKVDIFLTA